MNDQQHFPPCNIQNYKVLSIIGKGSFGAVYAVKNQVDRKKYAAKVIKPQGNIENIDKLIAREISILIRVKAPTIVQFYGVSSQDFEKNPNPTIFLEYIDNGSLKNLIDQEERNQSPHEYDNTAKQIILCGIAHGMMVLHKNRVIHRDLKPDNVLIDSNYQPHITDFGLSKFLDLDNSKSQSQVGIGSPRYMAPEVIKGTHYGPKADVFSFAILMYEVITGQRAYQSNSGMDQLNGIQFTFKVYQGERPHYHPSIKNSLWNLIQRCWSADPDQRPTFRELFNKLSLSFEDDSNPTEQPFSHYCLDDVDFDKVAEYVDEITSYQNVRDQELRELIEKQARRIDELEENYQRGLEKLDKKYQKKFKKLEKMYQQRIEQLEQMIDQDNLYKPLPIPDIEQVEPSKSQSINRNDFKQLRSKIKRDNLETIEIPSSIKVIVAKAFKNCTSLKTVIIPDTITTIGKHAFFGCSQLTNITIPQSVTVIHDNAFEKCINLTQITIPSSVTSIGEFVFANCSQLETITFEANVTVIGKSTFFECASLQRFIIPSTVTTIGQNAFSGCASLTQISIPRSVTTIEKYAFSNCSALRKIIAPTGIKSIGNGAFSSCPNIQSVAHQSLASRFGSQIFD